MSLSRSSFSFLYLSLERRISLNGASDSMSDEDLNTIVDQRQVSLSTSGGDEDVRCINKVMQVSALKMN
jgi:hypothetical protein